MSTVLQIILDTAFSPLTALNQLINASDAKIISNDGKEVLKSKDKLQEVASAIKEFKNEPSEGNQAKKIVVNFQ